MASQFSEELLVKRLGDLNQTQNSIQTLSTWLIHYRKHAKAVAKVWYKEYRKAQPLMKLTFIYLANDIIQNSRKKGAEYCKVFAAVLPAAYKEATRVGDAKTYDSLKRLISIWRERQVYEDPFLEQLNGILSKKRPKRERDDKFKKPERKPAPPSGDRRSASTATKRTQESTTPITATQSPAAAAVDVKVQESPMKKIKTADILSFRDELNAQLAKDRCEPPDLEEMIVELSALLKSPSADSVTRHRIASFPTEVGDYGALNNIRSRKDCEALLQHAAEADEVLIKYNEHLSDELQDRKRVAVLLRTFLLYQNDKVKTLETRLKEFREKLAQVNEVRAELSSHLSKLPDLSMLPDTSGGLKPLPTVDVLFN